MKYLHKRNEFLKLKETKINNLNLENELKTSVLVNEVFENDITWGGSMIGRLINSSIRRMKIGYSQTRVEPLIKKLEDELNYLLSASIQGDTLKKYNELLIRSYLEEIRNTCLSNQTDDDKLDELLGQHTGLYDPNDPKKNQRTLGIVQEALDVITDDLKDLKKIVGEDRDKLIDKLSDFNDDLRKLTVPQGTPVQPTQQSAVGNFNLNFLNVLNSISNTGLITASFKFPSFANFIIEKAGLDKIANYTDEQFEDFVKKNPGSEELARKLRAEAKSKNTVDKKEQSKIGTGETPKTNTEIEKAKKVQGLEKVDKNSEQSGGGLAVRSKITQKEIDEVIEILNKKDEEEAKKDPKVKKLLIDIDTTLPKDSLSKFSVQYDKEETTLSDSVSKLKLNAIKESNYVILEQTGGAMGTQSGTQSGNVGGQNTTKQTTVKDIWDLYEFDKNRAVTRLTQREVDELNSLLTKGTQNLRYDPEKRPDPIVSISRIFGEAHNLYYCDVIPSGRPNGRVSQKTFREYVKLGKVAGKWVQGEAPDGPFAVKSIFNKWKTGVEKLLMNQEYRKILANMKFVVPGAEDTFNDNFNTKIYEAEGDTPVKKQSDGQILFEFMNNMLDKNKLDDFDTLRSSLMSKYFGIKISDKDKKIQSEQPQRPPAKEDFESNVSYFAGLLDPKIDVNKYSFYALPIKKFQPVAGRSHDIIFLQAIKKIDVDGNEDALLIKFTYDDPIIVEKYHEKNLKTFKYVDWSQTGTNKIYYGLIRSNNLKMQNGSKFTLVYGNVNNREINQVYTTEYQISDGKRTLASGEEVNMTPSKFVFNDNNSVNDIKKSFETTFLNSDKPTHNENLEKSVKGLNKKLIDVLKEEFRKL